MIYLTDQEFIIFLCEQIRDIYGDGDDPDLDRIDTELKARGIDFDDVFTY